MVPTARSHVGLKTNAKAGRTGVKASVRGKVHVGTKKAPPRKAKAGRKAAPRTKKTSRRNAAKSSSKTSVKTSTKTSAQTSARPRLGTKTTSKAATKPTKATTSKAVAKPKVRPQSPAVVEFKERPGPVAEARPLRIVVFGGSGNIGKRIVKEAVARGHRVTAVMRNPDRFELSGPNIRSLRADATDPLLVSTVARGHDVIVSAIGATRDAPESLAQAAQAILQGAREAGIKRVMVVNGAGSLQVAKGKMLMDSAQFPADWRWIAKAHKDALDVLRKEGQGLDWTAVSPPAMVEPGKRTGKFRVGGDALVADAKGDSRISMEDYAAAFMDELEGEHYVGKRMTVAY